MKILIAYDGSKCSDAAIENLVFAGLPSKLEVLILWVIDPWLPQWPSSTTDSDQPAYMAIASREALQSTQKVVHKLKKRFPGWKLKVKVSVGSPASVIVDQANKWKANLIVMGSHGRSFLNRLVLGSVFQSVVTHAHCSVRISHGQKRLSKTKAAKILIATDGSLHSKKAIERVASGYWPSGSEARVIAVFDPNIYTQGVVINIQAEEQYKWFWKFVKATEQRLVKAGLKASGTVLGGNPKVVLVGEAEKWNANCIFVGARGQSQISRILLGSVSTAVAKQAHCSVEIVRA